MDRGDLFSHVEIPHVKMLNEDRTISLLLALSRPLLSLITQGEVIPVLLSAAKNAYTVVILEAQQADQEQLNHIYDNLAPRRWLATVDLNLEMRKILYDGHAAVFHLPPQRGPAQYDSLDILLADTEAEFKKSLSQYEVEK